MRVSQFLGLVVLPLTAAMPAAMPHHVSEVGKPLDRRAIMVDGSQFNFSPFNLTSMGMECARPSPEEMYACELRCEFRLPHIHDRLILTPCCQSTGMTRTL